MADDSPKVMQPGHWTTDPFSVLFVLLLGGALLSNLVSSIQERLGIDPNSPVGPVTQLTTGMITSATPLGTVVRVEEDLVVYAEPTTESRTLGTQLADTRGSLVAGPVADENEALWWEVDFAVAPDGWVAGDRLRRLGPTETLGVGELIGAQVRTIQDTALYGEPAGFVIGQIRNGMMGQLTGGPITINNVRWREVLFENTLSGWVPEFVLAREAAPGFFSFLRSVKFWYTVVSLTLSALLFTAIVIIALRLYRVRTQEMMAIWSALPQKSTEERNLKWEHVLELVNSERPGEWRQAIIEADIILDEMVTKMGYTGVSLGEKLKQIEPSDFFTLNEAWEAHKIRNKIAHEGSDYILTQREARRIIGLYEAVFKEYYYI